jgi:hypothetical protein
MQQKLQRAFKKNSQAPSLIAACLRENDTNRGM